VTDPTEPRMRHVQHIASTTTVLLISIVSILFQTSIMTSISSPFNAAYVKFYVKCTNETLYEIPVSHGGEYEDDLSLRCCAA
jgi:hypothetical protein